MTHAFSRTAFLPLFRVLSLGWKKKPHFVLLKQQRPLTDAEFERTLGAWTQGKRAYEERGAYLKSEALDPATYMPGLGWNDLVTNPFREFLAAKPSRERANQLRLHTESFTGYSLYHFSRAEGLPPAPDLVPVAEFDAKHRNLRLKKGLRVAFERIRKTIPEKCLARVPRVMGEVGWDVDGYTLNPDTVSYQDSMATMYRAGILGWLEKKIAAGRSVTVLEIGSGYGGFSYLFEKAFPGASYWGCDLAESVGVAGMYLSVTLPDLWRGIYPNCGACAEEGMFLIPNHRFEEFTKSGRKVDLVINMMSLSEMPEVQIKYYGRKVSELVAEDGVFFEQNYDNRHLGWTYAKEYMPSFFKVRDDLGDSLNRGHTHLWANADAVFAAIAAERPGANSGTARR